jgi:hypothetical protein
MAPMPRAVVANVIAVAACGLVAGCAANGATGSDVAMSAKVPPSRYAVCASIVGSCAGAAPKHEPGTLYLSGDGSLWAKDIAWSRWGTPAAVGHGTAEANNCQPDCAGGTYSAHPVTITLSDPRPWHGDLVYTRAAYSIPSLHEHQAFSHGLLPGPAPSVQPQASMAPPAPGPVSNQADVSGSCLAGYEPAYADGNGNVAYGPFTPGQPHRYVAIAGTRYAPTVSYQLTLTNTGSATAQVSGFVVAFYDVSGSELGSDQQTFYTPTYLTAGQSLAWTEFSGTDTIGNGLSGDGGTGNQDSSIVPTGFATCQLVEWLHP